MSNEEIVDEALNLIDSEDKVAIELASSHGHDFDAVKDEEWLLNSVIDHVQENGLGGSEEPSGLFDARF